MLSTVAKDKSLKRIKHLKHLHLSLKLICQSVSPLGSPLTFSPIPVVRHMHSVYLTTGRSLAMIHLIPPQNWVRRDVAMYLLVFLPTRDKAICLSVCCYDQMAQSEDVGRL